MKQPEHFRLQAEEVRETWKNEALEEILRYKVVQMMQDKLRDHLNQKVV